MDKAQCLNAFWNSFSLPAYDENTVPSNASMPYITYETSVDSDSNTLPLMVSLWYYDTSWRAISQKADSIGITIGYGGTTKPYDGGIIWIRRGVPFAQRMRDPEDANIRRILITIEAEFISEN